MSQFNSTPKKTITVAVSCSVLLDLEDEYQGFEKVGYESFYANQVLNQHQLYKPGALLPFIRSLTLLNAMADECVFRLILITSNCQHTVQRALNSLEKYAIELDQIIPLNGEAASKELLNRDIDLFFTAHLKDAESANTLGIPSIHIPKTSRGITNDDVLHVAFDADGVLFDSESHIHFLMTDLNTFEAYEFANQALPLTKGPLMQLAKKLSQLKRSHRMFDQLIKLSVVSSRSEKAMSRVISSARYYKLAFDEFIACDGQNKGLVLKDIQAHLFLDDELQNVLNAAHHLPSGRVMASNNHFEHYAA